MDAQELQRVYLLKTSGLADVLSDINAITDAFQKSSEARAELAGNKGMFDVGQLSSVNKQLDQMLDIQGELLSVMKALNPEFSKSAPAFTNMAKGAEDAADGIGNLSNSAKSLGGNLSNVAPALLRVQSTLNTGKIEDYDAAINKLVADLVILQQRQASSKQAYTEQFGDGSSAMSEFLARQERNGATIHGDKVFVGKVEVKELSEEYQKLSGSITSVSVSYAEYLKEQLEITAQINQLTSAIKLLNNTNNPAVAIDNALAYKQQADAMALAAKSSNDLLQGQIELDLIQADINDKRKIAAYYLSGQAAEDEATLLQKQILFGEAWVADLDKQNAALERRAAILRANQELKGEAYAGLMDEDQQKQSAMLAAQEPSVKADRKVDIQAERTEVEMLKNKSILLNEESSYYQKLVAQLNTAKISLRLLSEEEIKNTAIMGPMIARVQKLDAEVKVFDAQMGNNQRNVGNYGMSIAGVGNVVTMFTRQLARGVGSLIIWGLLFDALSKVSDAIKEAIPGTDEYEQAQEKLAQANETLIKSFSDLSASYTKMREDQNTVYEGFEEGIDQAKRRESAIKSVGIYNAQANEAEVNQAQARIDVIKKEGEELQRKQGILKDNFEILSKGQRFAEEYIGDPFIIASSRGNDPQKNPNVQYELYNKLAKAVSDANLPTEQASKIMLDLNKAYSNGGNLIAIYTKSVREAEVALNKNSQALNTNRQEQQNTQAALDSKISAAIYSKNVELNNQLLDLRDQYRLLNEKREAESVDKIVRDIAAKYETVVYKIKQGAVQYAKTIMTVPEVYKKGTSDEDFDAMYTALPDAVKSKTDSIIKANYGNETGEKNNVLSDYIQRTIETYQKQQITERKFGVQEAQHNVGILGASSDFGLANYDKMKAVLDAKRNEELLAAKDNFLSQMKLYKDNKTETNELARLYDAEQEKIESEHYKNMLAIGMQYFQRITALSDQQSKRLVQDTDTYNLSRTADVLESHHSQDWKDRHVDKIAHQNEYAQASEDMRNAQVDLQTLQGTKANAMANSAAALSSGDMQQYYEANVALNKVLDEQAKLEHDIQDARVKKANAKGAGDTDWTKLIGNQMIETAQTVANAYMDLLAKQDAYREEMAQRSLSWNQEVQKSEVQSNNEQLAEDKANMLAQRQLSKEKMQDDKKRAQSQLIISYVIGLAKDWEMGWPAGAVAAAAQTVGLGVSEAELAKAPTYAQGIYGKDTHPGGLAWVGDGGEHEVIISPKTATLMNLQAGSQVIPMSHLGADLRAPRFNSTSTFGGGGSNSVDVQVHEDAINNLYGLIGHMAKQVSNIQVNYDAKAAQKAGLKASFGKRNV